MDQLLAKMSLTFIPGEKNIKEEDRVWYYGGSSMFEKMVMGHLILTDKQLLFYERRPVNSNSIETVGLAFNLPLAYMVGAKVEERTRSKNTRPLWKSLKQYERILSGRRTLNKSPGIFDSKETYYVLMLTFSIQQAKENPVFEVNDPIGWIKTFETSSPLERLEQSV